MPVKIRIGTRGSRLSILQTEEVVRLLKARFPDVETEIVTIKTKGDIDRRTPLYRMREKGVFEKEVDLALLRGEIDIAVHSAKDVPTSIPEEVTLAAVPPRKPPYDAFISIYYNDIRDLPKGARVGTSSLRRLSFLKYLRRDVEVVPIRGNVDTRLRKLRSGNYDALIVAEAGLQRLNVSMGYRRLDPEIFVPPAGQGALAVLARKDDREVLNLLRAVDDHKSKFELSLEKEIVRKVGAGCRTPIGVLADLGSDRVKVRVATVSPDFERMIKVERELPKDNSVDEISNKVAEEFIELGGGEVLDQWRRTYEV